MIRKLIILIFAYFYKQEHYALAYDVFLGGSCNPTTWRMESAIPLLEENAITYYNPQVDDWHPGLVALESEAKQTARVLLFVIDKLTRNCVGIIEIAELAATRRESLVIVMSPYSEGQLIQGETMSSSEYEELMNALFTLQYIMDRQKIPIFESIPPAIAYISKILRDVDNFKDLFSKEDVKQSRISIGKHDIDIGKLEKAFQNLDNNKEGKISLPQVLSALQDNEKCGFSNFDEAYVDYVNKKWEMEQVFSSKFEGMQISFEQFCAIASEWSWRFKFNGIICKKNERSAWNTFYEKKSNILTAPYSSFLELTYNIIKASEKRALYIGVEGKDLDWVKSSGASLIESTGLTFYHPAASKFEAHILPLEFMRIKNSELIMLVISRHVRGMGIMTLAAHLIGLNAKLILCIQTIPADSIFSGDSLSITATKDYNRARVYLLDMAKQRNIPVYENIDETLNEALTLLQKN